MEDYHARKAMGHMDACCGTSFWIDSVEREIRWNTTQSGECGSRSTKYSFGATPPTWRRRFQIFRQHYGKPFQGGDDVIWSFEVLVVWDVKNDLGFDSSREHRIWPKLCDDANGVAVMNWVISSTPILSGFGYVSWEGDSTCSSTDKRDVSMRKKWDSKISHSKSGLSFLWGLWSKWFHVEKCKYLGESTSSKAHWSQFIQALNARGGMRLEVMGSLA